MKADLEIFIKNYKKSVNYSHWNCKFTFIPCKPKNIVQIIGHNSIFVGTIIDYLDRPGIDIPYIHISGNIKKHKRLPCKMGYPSIVYDNGNITLIDENNLEINITFKWGRVLVTQGNITKQLIAHVNAGKQRIYSTVPQIYMQKSNDINQYVNSKWFGIDGVIFYEDYSTHIHDITPSQKIMCELYTRGFNSFDDKIFVSPDGENICVLHIDLSINGPYIYHISTFNSYWPIIDIAMLNNLSFDVGGMYSSTVKLLDYPVHNHGHGVITIMTDTNPVMMIQKNSIMLIVSPNVEKKLLDEIFKSKIITQFISMHPSEQFKVKIDEKLIPHYDKLFEITADSYYTTV